MAEKNPAAKVGRLDVTGTLTAQLFEVARPLWDAQLEHPFVRGIGDGTLEEARFANWVRQDYLYLKEFARVFAWAAARADRLESMAWYAAALDLTLNTEMGLHRTYAERFGIPAAELEAEPMWPTTRAYTDFLVRTAAEGDMADLLAALLPCAWGYVYVAERLASRASETKSVRSGVGKRGGDGGAEGTSVDDRYADWIAQYTSEDFRSASEWLRAEMDRVAGEVSGDKRKRLTELFLVSSRYEWDFWEMCWRGWQAAKPEASGFDGR